jgi:replicative DNA helicase
MNPTALAERATLGTLLVDPAQIVAVQGFLRPADFLHVWHRNIYAAMLTRQIAKDPITPTDIHADLVAAGHPEENRRAVRLIALMEVAPARPKAIRYAAMVLEASLRRQVRDLGLLLQAGAVVAGADTTGHGDAHAGPFAEIEAQLRDARERWNAASTGTVDAPITPDVKQLDIAAAHRTNVALRAARLVDAATRPRAGQALRAELNVLAAVLANPSHLAAVRMRITGSLFTDQTHLATYAAICDLADLGEPIDAISVCWQAQREQTLRGKGLDANAVVQLTIDPPAGDPGYHAGVMADLATRTVADRCAQQLALAAEHPGITVADLLDTAGHHVAAVGRAIAGPPQPRPGSWSRPRHLQLVAAHQASASSSAGVSL